MNDPFDPFSKLLRLWSEGASSWTTTMQAFLDAAGKTPATPASPGDSGASGATDPPDDPARQFEQFADRLFLGLTQLTHLQSQTMQHWLETLPQAGQQRLHAQTFSQLDRLVASNWEQEARRLSRLPVEWSQRAAQLDPQRLASRFESMIQEYTDDLKSLDDAAFKLNTRPLVEAWTQMLTGQADEHATRIVERFLQAYSVKTRYGMEYYADPDLTSVGQTPRELIHRQDQVELYHYLPATEAGERQGDPILLVYSVINRSYILDLLPGNSFVEHLLQQGADVYLVEWGAAQAGDRTTTLDSYVDPGLTGCIEVIRQRTGASRVALLGHCIGGNLALMLTALYPDTVSRLVTLTTPITSAQGGVVSLWTDKELLPIDAIIDAFGLMPAKLIRYTFMALKPYYEIMKWKMFYENLGDDQVMALFYPVDRWANDNVDIPGEVFRAFIKEVFHADRFRRGETRIHGRPVDLTSIRCPLMNLAASKDWIVPPQSVEILNQLVSSQDNRFVLIDGAHVGIMIDRKARPLWNRMSDFLLDREAPSAT
ncbi:MAG: alpha/beta fold hydrolase [Bradymonadales bacterium]|nr:alpha/beta fold hydrolase [Bradymonadales bacterium]